MACRGLEGVVCEGGGMGNVACKMMAWMIDTFGPSGTKDNPMVWTPDQRWYANNAKFWFRDKKDLEWFMLKWS